MIDIQEKKNRIISFLKISGPSLPVRIAKTIEMDPIFASAILSELLGTKQIKTSHMKVGASPLYFIPGQEQKLEDHIENLKPLEKEALLKLKENETLKDENEDPPIRIALRNIKDFAIPSTSQNKIIWKYAFASEEKESANDIGQQVNNTTIQQVPHKQEPKKIENIFNEKKKGLPQLQTTSNKQQANTKTFLKKIENFLKKQNTEIISIEEVDKKKVIAKIKSESGKALLFAFNKKRITESELIKCYKKAKTSNLLYRIITSGEPTKKMNETIDAYKKLIKIDKIENTEP